MQTNRSQAKNRPLPAVLAAMGITLVVGVALFIVGANAVFQPVRAQAAADPAAGTTAANQAAAPDSQMLAAYQEREKQLTDRINEYQQREQQLAEQLKQVTQERDSALGQAQQYQQILQQLQQAGVIQIDDDGQIFLMQQPFFQRRPRSQN
jgi:hypothetical protein